LAKIFSFLPFGSIAFKVNLSSAFFGAVLTSLVFFLIDECLKHIFPYENSKLWRVISGALAASLYAVSNSLWQNSVVAEVYTLQNCFIVLIALLLVRSIKQEKKSCLFLAGFLFGLSTGAHIIMILYIPALLFFLWLFYRNSIRLSHLGIIIMFVILGASIYLYLPVRSSVNPYYDWGNPENVENFITQVTDKKDAKDHFAFSPQHFMKTLKKYGHFYFEDFNVLGIFLGLSGLVIFGRKNPRLFIGLGAFFFSQWPFFIRYWQWPSAYIGTFVFFTVGIGVGIFASIRKLVQLNPHEFKIIRYTIPGAVAVICIIHLSLVGCYNFKSTTRSGYWSPYLFSKQLFDSIASRGILISKFYYFGSTYLQQCEKYRADITNMNLNDFLSTQLFSPLDASKYPLIQIPPKTQPHSLTDIINANREKQLFYFEPSWDVIRRINKNLKPEGILLSLSSSPYHLTPEGEFFNLQRTKFFFARLTADLDRYNDYEEKDIYGQTLESLGMFFYKNLKAYKASIAYLALAYELDPHIVNVLNGLSSCYLKMRRYSEAEKYAKEALDIESSNSVALNILGEIYFKTGRYTSAFWCYQKALQADSHNREAYFGIGRYFTKLGNTNQARKAFQKVIDLSSTNDALALAAKKEITIKGNY
jgi:tetratricopeptide (TPR) repeat protein